MRELLGLVFQLPMVIYFLTKAGLVDKFILREYRRHAIVIILVFGAILTPPDPFSHVIEMKTNFVMPSI
jgi:Sec-independent protein secretion pathway component TatC